MSARAFSPPSVEWTRRFANDHEYATKLLSQPKLSEAELVNGVAPLVRRYLASGTPDWVRVQNLLGRQLQVHTIHIEKEAAPSDNPMLLFREMPRFISDGVEGNLSIDISVELPPEVSATLKMHSFLRQVIASINFEKLFAMFPAPGSQRMTGSVQLTREQVVTFVANKLGGNHYEEPSITEDIQWVRRALFFHAEGNGFGVRYHPHGHNVAFEIEWPMKLDIVLLAFLMTCRRFFFTPDVVEAAEKARSISGNQGEE